MVPAAKSALTIVIISSIACSAFAIQCYHCNSLQDTRCDDNFETLEEFKVDCDRLQQQRPQQTQYFGPFIIANATGCVKRLFDHLPGKPRIQRTCFYGNARHSHDCLADPNSPSERALSCDLCKDSYCNTSSTLKSVSLGSVLGLVLARIFF